MCVCTVYVCASRRVNVCVTGSRARHCQFYLDSQRNLLPNEIQGVSSRVSYVRFDTLNVVFGGDTTVYTPCEAFLHRSLFRKLFKLVAHIIVSHKHTHTFILRSPAADESKEHQSQYNGHNLTASLQCHCRAFSHTAVWNTLLFLAFASSLWTNLTWVFHFFSFTLTLSLLLSASVNQTPACFRSHACKRCSGWTK